MKKIVCKNYDEMSREAAQIIAAQIKSKPSTVLGLATGSTPVGTYKELIRLNKAGEIDFSKVITYNLDEYYKISRSNNQSYFYFMHDNLFNHVNIDKNNVHVPNGSVDDPEKECKNYDSMIEQAGGIDLQVLGIGHNGHIGFNEPAAELDYSTHLTSLTEDTIEANARFFNNKSEVPTQALTMGMGPIFKAKKIILLVSGKNKADVLCRLFDDKLTGDVPASLLKLHPDTTLIVDEDAMSKLNCCK